jgi:NADH-quinone oxidoreductase subunit E
MAQINDLYYEDLTPERMAQIIDDLRAGKEVPMGSQTGRQGSAPDGGPRMPAEAPAPKTAAAAASPAEGER